MIREATPADLYAIETIARRAFSPFVAEIGKKPAPMVADFSKLIDKGLVEVSVSALGVKGYCVSYPKGMGWFIENLAISPDHHGNGEGRALISDVETRATAQGFESIDLFTNVAMEGAITFYQRLGYVELYRREVDGFKRAYFRKNLV